jgi:hypothetical protein
MNGPRVDVAHSLNWSCTAQQITERQAFVKTQRDPLCLIGSSDEPPHSPRDIARPERTEERETRDCASSGRGVVYVGAAHDAERASFGLGAVSQWSWPDVRRRATWCAWRPHGRRNPGVSRCLRAMRSACWPAGACVRPLPAPICRSPWISRPKQPTPWPIGSGTTRSAYSCAVSFTTAMASRQRRLRPT